MRMMRLITAGTSFMGQEPAEAHFGLGAATEVDEVVIEWPDGTESVFLNVPANQVVTLENSASDDADEGETEVEEAGVDGEGEGETEGELPSKDEPEWEGERSAEEAGVEGEGETEDENDDTLSCPASLLTAQTAFAHHLKGLRKLRDRFLRREPLAVYTIRSYYHAGS